MAAASWPHYHARLRWWTAGGRYLVVGAGPGGLAAARWMTACAVPFDLVERQRDVGGIWDIQAPGSPMYESAHFISSKTLFAFRDWPMPESYPDYPSHRQALSYLRAYADRHDVRPRAEFGVEVVSARPASPGNGTGSEWLVELATGERRRYDGVILATGLQWNPRVPDIPGRFDGETLHSSAFRTPALAQGRRILVVGGGNSGCDIAVDVSRTASRAFLSLRRGYWFMPKHLFGVPADVFGHRGPELPRWLEQAVFERLLRLLVGDLARLGLPAPDHRLFETHPVLNTQVLHALGHGDLTAKPDVREVRGRRVIFADGSGEDVDLIIFATGYRRVLPVLGPGLHGEGDVSDLFLNLRHRRHPTLFVLGFFETDAGCFPLLDLQAELVARLLRARRDAPAKLARFEGRSSGPPPDFSDGVRFLGVERMSNYVRSRPYARYLEPAIRELA
jgi:cation diffusion facilitator CzcD-associated flavoprotein CzcO